MNITENTSNKRKKVNKSFRENENLDLGKILAQTFMKEINMEDIFQSFIQNNISEYLTQPTTSANNSSKSKESKPKSEHCVHGNRRTYAKVIQL